MSLVSLQATGKAVNNNSLTAIQRHPTKMAPFNATCFENNGTLPKWHVTKTTPEIDKYDTHKKRCLTKIDTACKKMPKARLPYLPSTELSDF